MQSFRADQSSHESLPEFISAASNHNDTLSSIPTLPRPRGLPQHSDSVLTIEEEEEEPPNLRQTSTQYMEDASMEVQPLNSTSFDSQGGSSTGSYRIHPSGRLGRRHTSETNRDIILVTDQRVQEAEEEEEVLSSNVFRTDIPKSTTLSQQPGHSSKPTNQIINEIMSFREDISHDTSPVQILELLFQNVCTPGVPVEAIQAIYESERQCDWNQSVALPNHVVFKMEVSRLQILLQSQPDVVWALPRPILTSLVRILVRIVTDKDDTTFLVDCGRISNNNLSPVDIDTMLPGQHDHYSIYNAARLQATQPLLPFLWATWEAAPLDLKPVWSQLIGALAMGHFTPALLRRILASKSPCIVRALTQATAVRAPRPMFHFSSQPLERSIRGVASWPFRNDFGLAMWIRAEHYNHRSVLFSARSSEGGGIAISLVPLDGNACTVAFSVYDSGKDIPIHELTVRGCVLVPRVWYHLCIRHTRSRLKGVFSLSTRQQLSIMLDGKVMLTESLPFPKISYADFREESLLHSPLRRSASNSSTNLEFVCGRDYDGQMGRIFVFNDNVSDASFRALFELTGTGENFVRKRSLSSGDGWDARRSDIVRKSRVLEANIANDDAEEIVLSQRRKSKSKRGAKYISMIDLGESSENEEGDFPQDLVKSAFGSKIYLIWDPLRVVDQQIIELHIGAHVKMDRIFRWCPNDAKTIIGSLGGVQSLVTVFRSMVLESKASFDVSDASVIPDLFRLLAAFVRENDENARELLRCGGIDVIEHTLFSSKKLSNTRGSTSFGSISTCHAAALDLSSSLLQLRAACAHYAGLETKVFSRLLFNIPLWFGSFDQIPGIALYLVHLPILSQLVRSNPGKVRDCVGVKDMIEILKEIVTTITKAESSTDRFDGVHMSTEELKSPLSLVELKRVADILLGMIFEIFASGTSSSDLAPYLRYLAAQLKSECLDMSSVAKGAESVQRLEQLRSVIVASCMVLVFLIQVRPVIPGLFESIVDCFVTLQTGVSFFLGGMVNSSDEEIRSLGIRAVSAFLEATTKNDDSPFVLPISLHNSDEDVPTTVQTPDATYVLASSRRVALLAKGLVTMGPSNIRQNTLSPFKLTSRIVLKLLWHLLKSHRDSFGEKTRLALLYCITDDSGMTSSLLVNLPYLRSNLVSADVTFQPSYRFSSAWASSVFQEVGSVVGRSLRQPLGVGTVLRLLRFLPSYWKDRWLDDFLTLVRTNRKSATLLSSLPDWQPSLFQLLSDTLEQLNISQMRCLEFSGDITKKSMDAIESYDGADDLGDKVPDIRKRLDRCLELYSALLGSLVREGGDKSLEAVETTASLQRVCVNGHDVLLLILSALCSNLFENGTLSEVGSISAEDWRGVDIENDSLLLRQSAKLVTDAIFSNGMKGLDMPTAVRSWRGLRHLTEVVVAVVTKSKFGVVDLFDYINQRAGAVDNVSGGLYGVRLPETRLVAIDANTYSAFLKESTNTLMKISEESSREVERHLCISLAAQTLVLLDAFIFPETLDSSLPASQLHGLALVRNSEPRLGSSQGPLVSSSMRLSLLLLSGLEPCSVRFLQTASRMRTLLYWALELIRESASPDGNSKPVPGGVVALDCMILAIVLHCHRALGRCASLLAEIESTSYSKYFDTKDDQKKHYRRLMRAALELRDIVSSAFRGRNDLLKATVSLEAYEDLRSSLEGNTTPRTSLSKENVVRDFLASTWVSKYQDVEIRADLTIPEQVSMDSIPISSNFGKDPSIQGFAFIESLARQSGEIVSDFEKALDGCFDQYLESQRRWAETDAVRDLEYEGSSIVENLLQGETNDTTEAIKSLAVRRNGAEFRWHKIQVTSVDPWRIENHWKLAKYPDPQGKRILLVPNSDFDSHQKAAYDFATGNDDRPSSEQDKLSDLMRRNAEAFVMKEMVDEEDSKLDDDSGTMHTSDGDSIPEVESEVVKAYDDATPSIYENDDEWDKIETEEIQNIDTEAVSDGWAKSFMWSEGESVVGHFESVMIVSLQSYVEGRFLLTTHGLYFKQTSEEKSVMTKESLATPNFSANDKGERRWRLNRLQEIHGRRFMLRSQALELFFSDSHELFLNFPGGPKERDRFYAKLRNNCKVPLLWSPKSLNPRTLFRKSKLAELWKKRKISNFDYIMALNRMAGRSFNDITQYPVFPWIIADFTSDTIDLNDSRIFRDLSKPIGALNPDRLAQLLERYKDLELFGFTDAEKFLYGTFYSSPGIVLHYLIRQEPFTTMAIELQSGRFDCPDRLFFDIGASWNSCMTSTSDMKELIPEFFCLPEMFLNSNKFPLGKTQSGRLVDNVSLPRWAKGSAYEFVRIHRLALESEYVSQTLHHWIDLVFGYKQRGEAAEEAHNVFHYLSYEGSVDLDKIQDEVDRKAAESHIQNFGQAPSQLLVHEPHAGRYPVDECWRPLIYDFCVPNNLRCYTPSRQFGNKSSEYAKGPVLSLQILSDSVLAIYGDMSVGNYRWYPSAKLNKLRMDKIRPLDRREFSTSRSSIKRGSAISGESKSLLLGSSCFAATIPGRLKEDLRRRAVIPSGRLMTGSELTLSSAEASVLLVSCGYWDGTIKAHGIDTCKLVATETGGHKGSIECLDISPNGSMIVTGGYDATTRIWVIGHPDMAVALSDGYVQTSLGASNDGEQTLSCCHVLWGQDTPITSVAINEDLDITISGSQDGLVCVHTIRRGEFIRSFRPPTLSCNSPSGAITKLALDSCGTMAVHMEDQGLHMFTINGVRLCSADAGERINDMKLCNSGEILITGGDICQVIIRKTVDLKVLAMLDLSSHGPIRSIALTPDDLNPIEQYLFIGSDDGMITYVDRNPL